MSDTTITPAVGALGLTGTNSLEGITLTPFVGSLVLAGQTAIRVANTNRIPAAGALAFTFVASAAYELLVAALTAGRLNGYRTAADTSEQWIHLGRCRLYGVYPEPVSTAGSIKLRNTNGAGGTTPVHTMAAGALAAGKTFGSGLEFPEGLSVQLSNAADRVLVVWEAL